MAKDPICGMEVEERKAVKLDKNGETYFFCSKICQDKFLNKVKDSNDKIKSMILMGIKK